MRRQPDHRSPLCRLRSLHLLLPALLVTVLVPAGARAQQLESVPFDSPRWRLSGGVVTEYLGRPCLKGSALLPDVAFHDGIIEVDMAVTGQRSYPGILFRMQDEQNGERFYVRPHRAGLYPDALQYTPVINGDSPWQLYSGEGCTAPVVFPRDRWVRVRLEVGGEQARVYIDGAPEPALLVPHLRHGQSAGWIGLMGPNDGTAYYADFRCTTGAGPIFPPAPEWAGEPLMIRSWQVSGAIPAAEIPLDEMAYPDFVALWRLPWQEATPDPTGLVDLARYVVREDRPPHLVIARTTVYSDSAATVRLRFGYSDEVAVFVNKRKLFYGNSSYQYRDPSFLGIIGLHDAVWADLNPGLNEIMLIVKETFGGWGFMVQAEHTFPEPPSDHGRLEKVWETPAELNIPESVCWDPKRRVFYVTSYNRLSRAGAGKGYVSRIAPDGRILDREWVTGLDGPCGTGLYADRLYVVECTGQLVAIDLDRGVVAERWKAPPSRFLNDLVITADGTVYISNTTPAAVGATHILKFKDGVFTAWKSGLEISKANGLCLWNGKLVVGSSGDCLLKAVDLETGEVTDIVGLGGRVIDGIRIDASGNLLVTLWEEEGVVITPDGHVTELLDVAGSGRNLADCDYVPELGLWVIATFYGNSVAAWRLTPP
jgi:sugar lactone lactonase YvrE